ncbi:MAG: hypothetical protein KY432_12215, partial [Acidobacteria bacterium]|nr:hypothetical protein [Acidobacteriota bacterium]
MEAAQAEIESTFAGEDDPARLRDDLETTIGLPKEGWPTTLIRQLADTLIDCFDERARSAAHE